MKKIKIVLMIVGSVFIVSCESNTYKELKVVEVVVANPTYTTNIAPIMTSYCIECHSVGKTSPVLTTYALVREATENGNLICRIDKTCGSIMPPPQYAPISQENITTIINWKTQSFKE